MWLNTVDVYSPATHSCKPATSLPKECAYGSAVAIGNQLYYVGGGNGFDWFSSMLKLTLDDPEGDWQQVQKIQKIHKILVVSFRFISGKFVIICSLLWCRWLDAK